MNHDLAAEEAVLGGIVLSGTIPPSVLDAGLKPHHFYKHGIVFQHALQRHDDGQPIDEITVPALIPFIGGVPNLGSLDAYAKRIVEKAVWRNRINQAYEIIDAAAEESEDKFARAEQSLMSAHKSNRVFDVQRLGSLVLDRLDAPIVPGFSYPAGFFEQLRMTPGTVHLWGGWTSHGKTVWIDQVARCLKSQDAKVWCWLNEMTAEERMCRFASATTGLPLQRVLENDLDNREKAKVIGALHKIPFGIVECPGWSGADIARDIRVRQPDVAVIDILHRVPYRDERDLARISQLLGDTAKLARCCILATVHLNRSRIQAAARPQPTLADIKGASSFEQDADVVGMVWREDDLVTGRPTDQGVVYTLKTRMGRPSGTPVLFDGAHAEFTAGWEG